MISIKVRKIPWCCDIHKSVKQLKEPVVLVGEGETTEIPETEATVSTIFLFTPGEWCIIHPQLQSKRKTIEDVLLVYFVFSHSCRLCLHIARPNSDRR